MPNTPLCDLFGIDVPIIPAPVGGFVKFTFWAPGWVASRAEIVWASKRESPPDFPLFNLTRPSVILTRPPAAIP